ARCGGGSGCRVPRRPPPQHLIEDTGRLQLPDALQADELRAQEFLRADAVITEGRIDLLDTLAYGPLGLEGGQARADLVAIHPIVAGVRAGVAGVRNFG